MLLVASLILLGLVLCFLYPLYLCIRDKNSYWIIIFSLCILSLYLLLTNWLFCGILIWLININFCLRVGLFGYCLDVYESLMKKD
jgi:uncharacterized protein with PQ loop repeat